MCVRHGQQIVDERVKVEPDRGGDVEQFDDVDATSAALDGGDDRLVSAEPVGELRLAEAGSLPLLHDEVDQAQLSGRAESLGHSPCRRFDGPTERVSVVSDYRKIRLNGESRVGVQ